MSEVESTAPGSMAVRPRVYLAGPDVFLPNARAAGRAKCAAATRYDLEGVFPLDAELDLDDLDPREQARRISLANEALMRSCDGAIANLAPFRGTSMDAGTAYEVGFMRALGRPVAGYTTCKTDYAVRVHQFRDREITLEGDYDVGSLDIEDFGLAENLMIDVAIHDSVGPIEVGALRGPEGIAAFDAFERCLARMALLLTEGR